MLDTTTTNQATRKEQTLSTILGGRADWRVLAQDGVMARVLVGRCGFTAKLELNDLGLSVQDARVRQALDRTLVLGEKRLLPEGYMTRLSRIESQARRLLAKNSFYIKASGYVLGYFLPWTAYESWKTETEACKQRYFALRDEIVEQHEALVQQIMDEYQIVARDTYRRIQEVRPGAMASGEEVFVTSYCDRIMSLIPSPLRIEETFRFEIDIDPVLNRLDDIAGEPDQRSILEPAQVRTEAESRAWQRELMQRDLLSQAQTKKRGVIDSLLSTIATHLRSLTYDAMVDVLGSIERRSDGKFPPRSLVQLKNLVEQLNQLNFYNDRDIERFMAQIQGILEQQPARRNRSLIEIQSRLRDIALVTRATLLELEVEPRTGREVAIPDAPAESTTRQARQALGLDLDDVTFQQLNPARQARLAQEVSLWNWPEGEASRQRRFA